MATRESISRVRDKCPEVLHGHLMIINMEFVCRIGFTVMAPFVNWRVLVTVRVVDVLYLPVWLFCNVSYVSKFPCPEK